MARPRGGGGPVLRPTRAACPNARASSSISLRASTARSRSRPHLRHRPFTMSRRRRDHQRMRELRAKADAILIGASNLRADDPDLALSADGAGAPAADRRTPAVPHRRDAPGRRGDARSQDVRSGARRTFDRRACAGDAGFNACRSVGGREARRDGRSRRRRPGPPCMDGARARRANAPLRGRGRSLRRPLSRARRRRALPHVGPADPRAASMRRPSSRAPVFFPTRSRTRRSATLERVGDELYLRYDFRWT